MFPLSLSFLLDPTSSISDALLPRFLLEVFIVIILTRSLGWVLKIARQPPVIGEIIGGILLGPSVLGQIPGWTQNLFPATSVTIFSIIANFGLIFFMFYLGLEVDMKLIRSHWRTSVPIAASAIVIPFGIGTLSSLFLQDVNRMVAYMPGQNGTSIIDPVNTYDPSTTAFVLFSGTAMSFTAFPVLASILAATKLMNTDLGIQALSCAAVDDVMAWCVLAIASSFAKTGNPMDGVYTALLACAFICVWIFPVRIAIHRLYDYTLAKERAKARQDCSIEISRNFIILLCLMLLSGAFTAEIIGIHAFFGAFVCGIIVPKYGPLNGWLATKIELLTVEFLLPLYFATSGLKTNIGTISSGFYGGITVAIIIIACVAKWVPSTIMTRLMTHRDWKFCSTIGILMNTRGLVELIALNIGLSMKILSPRLFTMMVIMALVTTFATSPLLYLLYQRDHPSMEMHDLVNHQVQALPMHENQNGEIKNQTKQQHVHATDGEGEIGHMHGAAVAIQIEQTSAKIVNVNVGVASGSAAGATTSPRVYASAGDATLTTARDRTFSISSGHPIVVHSDENEVNDV